MLDTYFVALKEPDANTAFEAYLKQSDMLDIRNQYRDLFVVGTDPVYQQISNAEEARVNNQ